MYELIQINDNDYYVNCPAKIGIVKISENEVIMIDSGNDKDAGRKVLRILEANNWKLQAIYNTHSHADHIGGNKFIQDRTNCKIYAKGMEAVYTNSPILEPIGLYAGLPMKDLKHKFLMAQASVAEELTEQVLPAGMQILPLPGHCHDMVGFLTPNGTAYIADCLSSAETLEKYGIGYMWDPATARKTLEYVKTIEAKQFVPAHAAMTENISELVDINIASIDKVFETILELCSEAVTLENLLKKVFDVYGMQANIQQFALIGSTLRSYLTNLLEQGKVNFEFVDNTMFWKKAE